MPQLYILYEHASGFAVFRTTEFEEVAVFLPQVRESILNISKFRSNVFFVAYQSFKEQKDALGNMQSMTAGELSNDLQLFLENNIPRSKKSKQPVVLGVEEHDLASVISDKLGVKCISSDLVIEIIRGIRFHFYKLIKGFKDEDSCTKCQLSLAHHYSRKKLNFDVTRQDCMIIESNNLVDVLEKDISTLGRRIREWYAFHFPELFKLIPHNIELYVHCVNVIGDRKNMPEDIEEKLSAMLEDSSKVETILHAAHNSMGTDICSVDLENLKMLCGRVISLMKRRQSTIGYLKSKMNHTAPNMSSLLGEIVGSKLISRAGGLEKLAKLTSSTVQVLGAEKKFFRSLKYKNEKVPISGLLSNSAFMGKAGKRKKGRLAKILANKCVLAARVDCFSKTRKEAFGKQLVQEVENNIKNVKNVKIQDGDTKTRKEAFGKQPVQEVENSIKNAKNVKIQDDEADKNKMCLNPVNSKDDIEDSSGGIANMKISGKRKSEAVEPPVGTKSQDDDVSEIHTNYKAKKNTSKKRKSVLKAKKNKS